MNLVYKIISAIGLGLTLVPSLMVFNGSMSWELHATLMLIGTVMWFATAPLWMKKEPA